jgi:UDP-N-acetylglucosamine 2-epimerase
MLTVGEQGRAQQISELVERLEEQFAVRQPSVVIVQGDTNTALGGALAANALDIPLAHVEHLAGLDLPVLFPVHPLPGASAHPSAHTDLRVRREGQGRARCGAPLGYKAFLGLAAECAFLLSDSGRTQEEASVVKRPAIVVRRSTERPEVLGTSATLVPSLTDLPGVTGR